MDVLTYYSPGVLSLEDIERCLVQAGYRTAFQDDIVTHDLVLGVLPQVNSPLAQVAYWRWNTRDVSWEEIDFEEREVIASIWKNIASRLNVWYSMGAMEECGRMLKTILDCFGGYVHFEHNLFDEGTILTIQEYVPKPPDDLLIG